MVRTPSTMLPLGTALPDATLPDAVTGQDLKLSDIAGPKGLFVMFISCHCPFVIHLEDQLGPLANAFIPEGLGFVAIGSNNIETHPDDAPDKMKIQAEKQGFGFPYLYDASQEVAKSFTAACTPDFFLFDGEGKLVYRGQFDDTRPGDEDPVTGADARAALQAVVDGTPQADPQYPSLGCNIKWIPGNEPSYFLS